MHMAGILRLSVCLSQLGRLAANPLLQVQPAGDIDQMMYGAQQCGG